MSAFMTGSGPGPGSALLANPGPATILCVRCEAPLDGTLGLTMCYDCIKLEVDVTEGIPREAHVNFCRNCERFLQPPNSWIVAQPESRELLALLLRRLRGLNKVRLVDAKFIWTEPHSRRIKIEVAVQGEAMPNVIVQQEFGVEYVVIATQCPDCAKSFTVNTWTACVQVRQKVPHKRTFFHLEQMILKYKAHLDTVTIKESRDGIDFYYAKPNHAVKMLDFLTAVAPVRSKRSQELISQDTHTGVMSYKFTHSVEIVPICRDDLVALPKKVANSMGCINQIVLCSKISNSLQFLDPTTLQTADMSAHSYWKAPFASLANLSQMIEFFVLDVEPVGPISNKYALADITVSRANDMNNTIIVRSHLGGILHPGDSALGYLTVTANYNNTVWDSLASYEVPDVVLVKKHYPRRTKPQNRVWKVRRMANEHNVEQDVANTTQADADRVERDFEMFLQQIEEDDELQKTFELYKKPNSQVRPAGDEMHDDGDSDGDDEGPEIDVSNLLEDLNINDDE